MIDTHLISDSEPMHLQIGVMNDNLTRPEQYQLLRRIDERYETAVRDPARAGSNLSPLLFRRDLVVASIRLRAKKAGKRGAPA